MICIQSVTKKITLTLSILAVFATSAFSASNPTEERFDSVSIPALPTGWSSVSIIGAQSAITTTAQSDSIPNSVVLPNPGSRTETALLSKTFSFTTALPSYKLKFDFKHKRGMESGFDGGVLEISINGAAFVDFKTAGGTFSQGDYNATVATGFSNPLAGRHAWSGSSPSFETVQGEISSIPENATIQFRFVIGTDTTVSAPGWFIDTFRIWPEVDSSVVITPLQNEIAPGASTTFDIGILNPSNIKFTAGVSYLNSPTGLIKAVTFLSSGVNQKYGNGLHIIQSLTSIDPLGVENYTVKIQDIVGRAGAMMSIVNSLDISYANSSAALAFLSSSPSIPGGVLAGQFDFVPFDPCGAFPTPLPYPLANEIVLYPGPPTCGYGAAALALQGVGVKAVIFAGPPPSGPVGTFPQPLISEAPTPGLAIPTLIYDVISFGPLFSGLTGGPGTTSVRLEGVFTAEQRTLPLGLVSTPGDDPISGNNFKSSMVSVVTDVDNDGTPDIRDACKTDAAKIAPGICGCGVADADLNTNGVADCLKSADFKAQLTALQKAVKKFSPTSKKAKVMKAQIKGLQSSVKTAGIANAASISTTSASVNIAKLTKAADKAVNAALKATGSNLSKAKSLASKAIGKLIKGVAA